MNIYTKFAQAHRRLIAIGVVAGVFSVSAVALATITSGTSTTNISAHVTYTQLTINKPTVSVGDVMVASIAVNDGSIVNVTAPSGWTQIARTDNDINVALISYYKVAGASEPSTYTWTVDEQTKAVGGITPYTGVDTSNPIDQVAGNTGFGTLATTSAITTGAANEEVIALYATDVNKTFSTPTGMNLKYSLAHISAGPLTAAYDAVQAVAGSAGSKSSTITGSNPRNWSSQQIALRPFVLSTNTYSTNLDQASTQYWSVNDNPSLSIAGSFTISAWINLKSFPTGGYWGILSKGIDCDTSSGQYRFSINNNSGAQRLALVTYDGSNADVIYSANYAFATSTWYHVVGTLDNATKKYTFYVNGSVIHTETGSIGLSGDNTTPLTIGVRQITSGCGGTPSTEYFDGNIDDVRLWNRELSSSEVSSLYTSPAAFNNGANLKGWWKFDNDGNDSSGENNNLTGINSPTFSTNVPY